MSGILAVIRTDREAIEPRLLHALMKRLAVRGPDAELAWCDGQVALGHTLLRTGPASARDLQPLTLDGWTWIVADARVDARRDLEAQLASGVEEAPASASDAELILRAYSKWGEGCVDRLLGDYAFAIWDRRSRRLFCARDHLGVKPLYYAHVGPWLLVSSTLESLRGHPAISNRLDDLTIADFLMFGSYQDADATAFRDIRRLPAAHALSWSPAGLDVRRYWTLPIEEPLCYRRGEEYISQFLGLLREAVRDRLRTERVGVFMSGGIDSPALAGTAVDLLPRSDRVHAYTCVYETLIPDPERRYAATVAQHLGIPIHFYVMDRASGWSDATVAVKPEPTAAVHDHDVDGQCYEEMAAHSRVAFYGEGPDNALLYEWKPYLSHLLHGRQWGRLLADFGRFLVHHRRLPLVPTIPHLVRARLGGKQLEPVFPEWMAPELVARFRLRDRWRDAFAPPVSPHPSRPIAYASFTSPIWQSVFETLEPSYTGVPLEVRHPYVDIRLLRFLLRVPAVPWCREKHLMRCALRNVLPEAVLRRRKTPLAGNPDYERARRHGLPLAHSAEQLADYGSADKLSQTPSRTVAGVEADLRLVALSHWLHHL